MRNPFAGIIEYRTLGFFMLFLVWYVACGLFTQMTPPGACTGPADLLPSAAQQATPLVETYRDYLLSRGRPELACLMAQVFRGNFCIVLVSLCILAGLALRYCLNGRRSRVLQFFPAQVPNPKGMLRATTVLAILSGSIYTMDKLTGSLSKGLHRSRIEDNDLVLLLDGLLCAVFLACLTIMLALLLPQDAKGHSVGDE